MTWIERSQIWLPFTKYISCEYCTGRTFLQSPKDDLKRFACHHARSALQRATFDQKTELQTSIWLRGVIRFVGMKLHNYRPVARSLLISNQIQAVCLFKNPSISIIIMQFVNTMSFYKSYFSN